MFLWQLLFPLVILLNSANGGRILAILGTAHKSHVNIFTSVINVFASEHSITFYHAPIIQYSHPNVTNRAIIPIHIGANFTQVLADPCSLKADLGIPYHTKNGFMIKNIYQQPNMLELINSSEKYDLFLLFDMMSEHFRQLAHVFNAPIIQVNPAIPLPWSVIYTKSPQSWVNDYCNMIFENTDTFLGRLTKFIKHGLALRLYNGYLSELNGILTEFYPPGTPLIQDMSSDLVLVNTNSVMGFGRPTLPTSLEIGGLHIKQAKPLPKLLDEFISDAGEHGFIYFSLGTLVAESAVLRFIEESMVNVFRKLPQRVLWKSKVAIKNKPDNVLVSDWFPQSDILGHKKIKLFITQGGILSLQEAVYYGVPVLVIPIVVDQTQNAFTAQQKGFGRTISFCGFSEELFDKTLTDLLQNTTYTKTAKTLSKIMQEQNADLPQRIRWWANFMIRHKGTKGIQPVPPYNTWNDMPVDIVLFFLIIFSIILFICYYLLKLSIKFVFLRIKYKVD